MTPIEQIYATLGFTGTLLGDLPTAITVESLAVIDDEAWAAEVTDPDVQRYALDGAFLGEFRAGPVGSPIFTMATVPEPGGASLIIAVVVALVCTKRPVKLL